MVEHARNLINRMKEITENVAHDLRRPVTRMRGTAEMAFTGDAFDGECAAMAGTIIEECDRLLWMINNTLDISEEESELMKLNEQQADLVLLLRDICDYFEPSAKNRRIKTIAGLPESVLVTDDLKKLHHIFSNLVDNAFKHKPLGGTVVISIKEIGDHAVVTVRDTSCDVPEDDLPHIFDRFFRGEESRSIQGSFPGLSLSRAYELAHRQMITAASTPDKGSEFTITLPKAQP